MALGAEEDPRMASEGLQLRRVVSDHHAQHLSRQHVGVVARVPGHEDPVGVEAPLVGQEPDGQPRRSPHGSDVQVPSVVQYGRDPESGRSQGSPDAGETRSVLAGEAESEPEGGGGLVVKGYETLHPFQSRCDPIGLPVVVDLVSPGPVQDGGLAVVDLRSGGGDEKVRDRNSELVQGLQGQRQGASSGHGEPDAIAGVLQGPQEGLQRLGVSGESVVDVRHHDPVHPGQAAAPVVRWSRAPRGQLPSQGLTHHLQVPLGMALPCEVLVGSPDSVPGPLLPLGSVLQGFEKGVPHPLGIRGVHEKAVLAGFENILGSAVVGGHDR